MGLPTTTTSTAVIRDFSFSTISNTIMKLPFLTTLMLLCFLPKLMAQLHFGEVGVHVETGTHFSFDRLTFIPSTPLTLVSTSMEVEDTPYPGPPPSISRVFHFSNPITFNGTIRIDFLDEELNGNIRNELEIAYLTGSEFMITSESTVHMLRNYVYNQIDESNLLLITAVSPGGTLPVVLSYFEVQRGESATDGHIARLLWQTTQEVQSDRFEIERSYDAVKWEKVGEKKAQVESTALITYTYDDLVPYTALQGRATVYYRLKMVDLDAQFGYSPVRSLVLPSRTLAILYPNPAREWVKIGSLSGQLPEIVRLQNLQGQVLLEMERGRNTDKDFSQGLDIGHLPVGVYLIKMIYSTGSEESIKLVKQ